MDCAGTCNLWIIQIFRIVSYQISHIIPVLTDRHRIKINYGMILAQHLVFCQLNNTISSVFGSLLPKRKIYFNFFKFFSSICFPIRYLFFRLTCYNSSYVSGIRSLITEEHIPSCIWVLVNGSLLTVLPSVRIKLHIVQPVNAAGKGAGNGGGRYVYHQKLSLIFARS